MSMQHNNITFFALLSFIAMGGRCGKSVEPQQDDQEPPGPQFYPSLAPLRDAPMFYMRQDLPSDITACCNGNHYSLTTHDNSVQLIAEERAPCVCLKRWCCGPARGFTMDVFDLEGETILTAERASCRCDWWCCFDCCCCQHRILIHDAEGSPVGRIIQRFSCCSPKIVVEDEAREEVALIKGPCCPSRCCCDLLFDIFSPVEQIEEEEEEEKGKAEKSYRVSGHIMKRWEEEPGVKTTQPEALNTEGVEEDKPPPRSYNFDHENSQIIFPEDAEDKTKALLLGGHFLVHYLYFEVS